MSRTSQGLSARHVFRIIQQGVSAQFAFTSLVQRMRLERGLSLRAGQEYYNHAAAYLDEGLHLAQPWVFTAQTSDTGMALYETRRAVHYVQDTADPLHETSSDCIKQAGLIAADRLLSVFEMPVSVHEKFGALRGLQTIENIINSVYGQQNYQRHVNRALERLPAPEAIAYVRNERHHLSCDLAVAAQGIKVVRYAS